MPLDQLDLVAVRIGDKSDHRAAALDGLGPRGLVESVGGESGARVRRRRAGVLCGKCEGPLNEGDVVPCSDWLQNRDPSVLPEVAVERDGLVETQVPHNHEAQRVAERVRLVLVVAQDGDGACVS